MARLVTYVASQDGASVGSYLRSSLSPAARREVVGGLLSREDGNLVLEFDRRGLTWTVPAGNIITTSLYVSGEYEGAKISGLLSWLTTHGYDVGPDRVAVDLGANVGTTTLPLAQVMHVLAVEPVPTTFDFLTHNIAQNGYDDRVVALRTAIGEKSGCVHMVTPSHGSSHIVAQATDDSISVPAAPLMELLDQGGVAAADVAFVWSDTEGTENAVVRTGEPLWDRGVPLFAEVWPHSDLGDVVGPHFTEFVPGRELAAKGPEAEAQPIARFPEYRSSVGDVLLIPRVRPMG